MNHRLSFTLLLILLQLSSSFCMATPNDTQIDLNVLKDKLLENIDINQIKSQLPEGLDIPKDFLNTTLPSIDVENTVEIIKEKCIKVSGSDAAYEEAVQGGQKLNECLMDLINVTALQEEIEKATPIGELDTVFNKYCKKRDDGITCFKKFTETVEPCLEPEELVNKKVIVDIFTSLLHFACEKDGDNIALFIAEKGPECLQSKKLHLLGCLNSTYKGYIPTDTPKTINDLPIFTFAAKECKELESFKKCAVTVLEECEEPTTANLAEAAFRFIRGKTPCANIEKTTSKTAAIDSKNNKNNSSKMSLDKGIIIISLINVWLFSKIKKD